jgi:nucleoside-diphosphate-sugar epimerase
MKRDGETIFVTGGTGFIGRHIVRALTNQGYGVRILTRRPRPSNSAVSAVVGNLSQPESFAAALQGASAVVHGALTEGLVHDLQAASTLHSLSAQAGVRKFLYLSTISVYGNPTSGNVTEQTTPIPTEDKYSRTKLAIEEALQLDGPCPEVAILRLGCVYGPGGGWWTEGVLNMMARGKLILVNGGTGHANLIHVEDVAAIVLRLLALSNPPFETYNVTDGQPVTWRQYFSGLQKILGRDATISMSAAEAREYGRKWLRPSLGRRVVRRLTGKPDIHPLDHHAIEGYASRAIYSSEKATGILGFRPAYDLASGIETVRAVYDSHGKTLAVQAPA